jgi:hypothetical protein
MEPRSFLSGRRTPIRVVSLTGAGRSGSTLIGNLLGQLPGVVHVGELCFLWNRGVLRNSLCGCGRPFRDCAMWTGVMAKPAVASWAAVAHELAQYPRPASRRLLLQMLRGRERLPDLAMRYAAALRALYGAIHEATDAQVIIDSSKTPSHVYIQTLLDDVDLTILHLLRDPRAVAFSWQRKVMRLDAHEDDPRPMARAGTVKGSLKWLYTNLMIGQAAADPTQRYRRVRYEDVVRAPRSSLAPIAKLMGIDPVELPFRSEAEAILEPSHTVWGNPNRLRTGLVRLRHDDEWKRVMPTTERYLVTALTWPLLRRYGY